MKTFVAAYINLLKTSIGSGVLSFPYIFKTYGVVTSIIFTFISGFFATVSLHLLAICSQELGRTADLSSLASLAMPYSKLIVEGSVFAKCFGVSLSYIIIAKDLLPSVLFSINSKLINVSSAFSLFVFFLFVGPFTYLHKMDKLKYTSFIGLFCIILVILASFFRYSQIKSSDLPVVEYIVKPNKKWISSFGKFIFSFTCHQNLFSVHSEIEDNSLPNMKKLIITVALTSFSLYISFGLLNYLIFSNRVSNNILKTYPKDILGTIVRGLYIIVMGVSYPLQMGPARRYLLNMLNIRESTKNYTKISFFVTSLLILCTYFIALSGTELGMVYSIVGATASSFMCLIFPALFYLNLDVERTYTLTFFAYLGFLLGIFIFVSTIYNLLF